MGCGCLLVLLALLIPRVVIVLLWLFSNWFGDMFVTPVLPVLGFLFLPTTLLWYSVVMNEWGGVWSFWPVIGLIVALLIDISPGGEAGRKRRRW